MTTVTAVSSPETSSASDRAVESSTASGAVLGGPNFHIGGRARIALAFAGLILPAATFLYFYGQLSPGV